METINTLLDMPEKMAEVCFLLYIVGTGIIIILLVLLIVSFHQIRKIRRKLFQMAKAVEDYINVVLADDTEETTSSNCQIIMDDKNQPKIGAKWSKEDQNRLILEVLGEYFS